jgi:Universal stress protein family.
MYERIVVPTDGSACASAAVEHATDIAQQYDASLHLLSVVDSEILAMDHLLSHQRKLSQHCKSRQKGLSVRLPTRQRAKD